MKQQISLGEQQLYTYCMLTTLNTAGPLWQTSVRQFCSEFLSDEVAVSGEQYEANPSSNV